jgi:hypothetical protein
VGRDNDQFSAYRVTLPKAAFGSGEGLAERLLSPDAPWSRDVFSHNSRLDLGGPAGRGFGSTSSGIIEGPGGDTLVIVRNSRGVQVGDDNVQRNQFRIRVSDVTVRADRLSMTRSREASISRLRENPGDRAAARRLAGDLTRAASTDLVVDLTARVREVVGHPQVDRWSGEVRDRTGIQVGGPGRARVRVHVTVSKFDSCALERQILKRAESLPRPTAAPHDTPGPRRAGDARQIRETGLWRTPRLGGGRGFR